MTASEESASTAREARTIKLTERDNAQRNHPLRSELTVEKVRERVDSSSDVLEKILHRSILPPRYGINE